MSAQSGTQSAVGSSPRHGIVLIFRQKAFNKPWIQILQKQTCEEKCILIHSVKTWKYNLTLLNNY